MATRVVSESTAHGDVAALNYLIADKYVRALQAFAAGAEPEGVHRADGARFARRHARRHFADRGERVRREPRRATRRWARAGPARSPTRRRRLPRGSGAGESAARRAFALEC